ncbi:MAG: hypothetical protein BMS9Abin02_2159 [Anaerolineae bacterium]|nr:MAG: hypothetical protein BMS9Abin02_2159 [Anaerolineae bacterium]
MSDRRLSPVAVAAIAIGVVLLLSAAGWLIFKGNPNLLRDVSFQHESISPNADGETDVTTISYELTSNADISIFFENVNGERFYFRQDEPRGVGEYQVHFSGVVDGYSLPGETIEGEILTRLLQNGDYTWTISAVDSSGKIEESSGFLAIRNADEQLPEMRNFTLDKNVFSPNQDGIDDRVQIQFFLPKEVVQTRVFVETTEGSQLPVAEVERGVEIGAIGRHYFDYEAGVDNKATPPPDGTYAIIAIAEDAEGQKIRVEDKLEIQFGGVPRAEIISPVIGDTVDWSATAVSICDTIFFTLTVQNYGTTPLRTSGPEPGTIYDSGWNYNTLGWHTESGAWRVGIGFENELSNYPYRWAIGGIDDLEKIGEHYYLMPGQRAVISGGIRVVGPFGNRNPQPVWAGLIHEDVEISQFNNRVDPHEILVDMPDEDNLEKCEPREIPRFD